MLKSELRILADNNNFNQTKEKVKKKSMRETDSQPLEMYMNISNGGSSDNGKS